MKWPQWLVLSLCLAMTCVTFFLAVVCLTEPGGQMLFVAAGIMAIASAHAGRQQKD